eukprot:TRINITY_DN15169_c0_g1_i3.p1 TRINITY_DN15169_c0_g1~~TRINITY_DN15169_c0_g1_i3.p1  ORF type:complete len:115 (-),score=27.36 TRINITY_DN15169_c0_g1_i3:56-400(-)
MPKTVPAGVRESPHRAEAKTAYQTAEPFGDSPINSVMPAGYCTTQEKTAQDNSRLFSTISPGKSVSELQEKLSATMCSKLAESIKDLMKSIGQRCESIEAKIDAALDSDIRVFD